MNVDAFFNLFKEIIHRNFYVYSRIIPNKPFDLEIRCFGKVIIHAFVHYMVGGSLSAENIVESDLFSFERDLRSALPDSHFTSILQLSSSQPIVFEICANTQLPVPPSTYFPVQYAKKLGDLLILFGVNIPQQKNSQFNDLLPEGTFVKKQMPYQILFGDTREAIPLPLEEPARLPSNYPEVLAELQREKARNPEFIKGPMHTPLSFDDNEMKKKLVSFAQIVNGLNCASFVRLSDAEVGEIPVWESHVNTTGVKTLEKIRKWENDTRQFFSMNDSK